MLPVRHRQRKNCLVEDVALRSFNNYYNINIDEQENRKPKKATEVIGDLKGE